MDIEKTYTDLSNILKNSTILKDEPMSKHTSFKIGGSADILVKAKAIQDIKATLEYCNRENIPLYVMGNGSNVLVKDEKVQVTVGAGVKLGKLAGELLKRGIRWI